MNWVVLDLDGTITKSDSLVAYTLYMLKERVQVRFLLFFPLICLLKMRLIDNLSFKKWYARLILGCYSAVYIEQSAQEFVFTDIFRRALNRDVLSFIGNLDGGEIVLLTANYSFLAEKIANHLGIKHAVGVDLCCEKGRFTGGISGRIPYGEEKIVALGEFISGRECDRRIGLGDSASDLPLLRALDEGYLVKYSEAEDVTRFELISAC